MQLNHKQKVKLARRMQSTIERKHGDPIFTSDNWSDRRQAKKDKVQKIVERARAKKNA